jgi:hypothetical protein
LAEAGLTSARGIVALEVDPDFESFAKPELARIFPASAAATGSQAQNSFVTLVLQRAKLPPEKSIIL